MINRTRSVGSPLDPRFARQDRPDLQFRAAPIALGREHRPMLGRAGPSPAGPGRCAAPRPRAQHPGFLGRNAQGSVRSSDPPAPQAPGRVTSDKDSP